MISDEEYNRLEKAFRVEKANAEAYAAGHNAKLPRERCPSCQLDQHMPGLACPKCRYRHPVAWAVVRSTEHGYVVISLTPPKRIYATFVIEEW